MSFVVVYDACVLYPSTLRDLLIRIAQTDLVQAKWTDRILDEVFGNIEKNRPDLDPDRLLRTRSLMNAAIADVLVADYEPLIGAVHLPDHDDRHVLAAHEFDPARFDADAANRRLAAGVRPARPA
jgi:hypothetical protein